jgi:Helix-turn-helix domain/GIY-YIG catalytic domain
MITTLYRYFSANLDLLYVGISTNPVSRLEQHSSDKSWIDDVASIKMEKFASRSDAMLAEARAIEIEQPLHNKANGSILSKIDCPNEFVPYVLNIAKDSLYLQFLCDVRLTQTDKTIWHGYASYIRLGNWVCTQQKLIAKRILCDVTTISIATKKLVEFGYLERKERGSCEYRIPKNMSYCGSWKHFLTNDEEFNQGEKE